MIALQERMADYIAGFARDGMVILPEFFGAAVLEGVQSAIDETKRVRPLDVVVDDLENGDRIVLGLMQPQDVQRHRMKINDLYLCQPEMRGLALAPGLVPVLWALLGRIPVLCNSLYLEKGSEQRPHVDALYMTPQTPGHLIAVWVALEDADAEAGPLEYYPGSHRIPPYVFSDGTHHEIAAEVPAWQDYMRAALVAAGLERQYFMARKGDVLIWHAHLLHGGGVIRDYTRTRRSCVFHYYSETDARRGDARLVPQAGAWWLDRVALPLPGPMAARLPFSETGYLRRYPDVAAALRAGQFPSGQAHYEAFGRAEGRTPR